MVLGRRNHIGDIASASLYCHVVLVLRGDEVHEVTVPLCIVGIPSVAEVGLHPVLAMDSGSYPEVHEFASAHHVLVEIQIGEGRHTVLRAYGHGSPFVVRAGLCRHIDDTVGRAVRSMKSADMLVCTEISRLGRSMLMIMSVLNACSQKGVFIRTIKDNFNLTDSINSKIIAFAFALAAEIERNLISQRTREALAARKQAGAQLGRPPGHGSKVARVKKDLLKISMMLAEGASKSSVARIYNVHRNTLSKCLKMQNQ